jgi:hypothetical protein
MTPMTLKLHLQSIKLQKSFYSSNFCYFMCAMMSRFAKFQGFFFFDHSHPCVLNITLQLMDWYTCIYVDSGKFW